MKTKNLLFKLLALLLAFGLVVSACGNDDDDDAASGDGGCEETYEVRYANLATFILYFRDLEAGLADFGAQNCWNFVAADAAYVIEDQVAQIEDFVTQGVDLIIASPGDRQALIPAYEVAAAAGIPMLSTGDSVQQAAPEIGFIGTDWGVEGTKQSEWMVEQMGGSGKIARIGGPGASEYVEKRRDGFEEVMGANPGIEVVFNQSANSFTAEEGLRLAQDALTANPDLDGIWADSDALALGAATAVEEAGIDHADFLVSGTDGIRSDPGWNWHGHDHRAAGLSVGLADRRGRPPVPDHREHRPGLLHPGAHHCGGLREHRGRDHRRSPVGVLPLR